MADYAPCNIFVGKYDVPENGHVRISNFKIRIIRGTEFGDGWREDKNGTPWLIIQDDEFLPVMIRLSEKDVLEPVDGSIKMLRVRG